MAAGALLVGLIAGACWIPHRLVSECPQLASSPPVSSLQLYGPERESAGARSTLRDGIYVHLYETRGVRLNFKNPYYEWCLRLSEADFELWLESAAILSRNPHLQGLPSPDDELVGVRSGKEPNGRGGLVALEELSPSGLKALQNMLCIGRKAFAPRITNAILEFTPELAARVEFPDSCDSLE